MILALLLDPQPLDIWHDPSFQFVINAAIAVLAIVTGIVVSFWIYQKQRNKKEISYEVISDASVISIHQKVASDVEIKLSGNVVKDVTLVVLKVSNTGNTAVRRDDYEDPLTFVFNDRKVISAEVIETNPKDLIDESAFKTFISLSTSEQDSLEFPRFLLNTKQSVAFSALLDGAKDKISQKGRIVDGTIVKSLPGATLHPSFRRRVSRNLIMLVAGLGIGALGYRTLSNGSILGSAQRPVNAPLAKGLQEIKMIFIQSAFYGTVDPGPLKDALQERSGLPVTHLELRPKTYLECVTRFGNGEFNILWDGPFAYVIAAARYKVRPILQLKNKTQNSSNYRGHILTKKSSGIRILADLKGRSLSYVDKYSASGYLYPRYELYKNGLDGNVVETIYAGSHTKSLENMFNGAKDACAVSDEYYKNEDGSSKGNFYKTMLQQYNVKDEDIISIYRSDPIPMGPIVVHADISESDVQRLQLAFFLLSDDTTLLQSLAISGFGGVDDTTYRPIRDIARNLNIDIKTLTS